MVGWTGEIQPSDKSVEENGSIQDHLTKAASSIPHGAVKLSLKDREDLEQKLLNHQKGDMIPVWVYDKSQEGKDEILFADQAKWRRFAEHDLFTLCHYKQREPENGREEKKRWVDYCRLNQKFADQIINVYKPGDIVWIHDYHLMLLPNILRQKIPNIYIGFFLHVPFPSSEFMKCLSRRKEILTGVLGANMVAFQAFSYARHFSSCCTRILGFDAHPAGVDAYGAHIAVDVFPIGINAQGIIDTAFKDSKIDDEIKSLRKRLRGLKVIVGRDRLDTVRGVAQKLQAYEVFLDQHPEFCNRVVLIQVTSPTSILEGKEDSGHKMSGRIAELISRINARYGCLDYRPVMHFDQSVSKEEYLALLRIADVALITSIRDGMNTTSLEFVVCQKDNHGPLILSEFSGTAGNLEEAIVVNPWNFKEVSNALYSALKMAPAERKKTHKVLYRHVTTHTVQAWTETFLNRLMANLASFNQSIATPALDKAKLLAHYRRSKRRLFMFDYDGTLTPIVKDPQAAIPSDRIIRTIKSLAKDKKNSVWIISGRDQAFLEEWMSHISELGLSAEHGSFIRQPESDEWENLTEKFDMGWQREVMEVFGHYTERTPGSWIERKRIALTWHYRRTDPDFGKFQAAECKRALEASVARRYAVEVMAGKANLEVRPTFVNKGEIARRLVRDYVDARGAACAPDFVFCSGDDATDEDMFRALRASGLPEADVFSVVVGASSKKTLAGWHLLEAAAVVSTISLLNGMASLADLGLGSPTAQTIEE